VDKDYSQTLKGSHNELGLNIYHHRKEKQINNTHFQIYTKKKKLTDERKTRAIHLEILHLPAILEMKGGFRVLKGMRVFIGG
jgi:hypothetical protein